MSECVVRMEMPESCTKCLAWSICPVLDEYMSAECYEWSFEDVLSMTDDEGFTKPDDCPIICSLPEGHGRLVDADAILKKSKGKYGDFEITAVAMEFYGSPTIVPAEAERRET